VAEGGGKSDYVLGGIGDKQKTNMVMKRSMAGISIPASATREMKKL